MVQALRLGGAAVALGHPLPRLFFLLYAIGWLALLPAECRRPRRARLLFWATAVRDAVDRLLPVASVGGSFVGVRMLAVAGRRAARRRRPA